MWCAGLTTILVGVATPLPAWSADIPQTPQASAVDTSDWVATTIPSDGGRPPAEFRVEPITTGEAATLRITGTGWLSAAGDSGSTLALKINDLDGNGKPRQLRRPDGAIGAYLSSLGQAEDPTIWALVRPEGAGPEDPDHGIFSVRRDGSFDITVKAPEELAHARPGHYVTVTAQSGRIMRHDVQRRGVSRPIPVDGLAAPELAHEAAGTCRSDVEKPVATIENRSVAPGGKLHLVGDGWCNPVESGGAPRVAIKIDEGKIARTDDAVFSNRTVWAIVDPDAKTGRLDVWIDLPDGSDAASSPALGPGLHSLRLLSGSLREGDLHTSYGGPATLNFTVGDYRPNGLPDTVGLADLGPEPGRHISVSRSERRVTVRLNDASGGEWVIATPYIAGSARPQWGSGWMRLSEDGTFAYDLPSAMAGGKYRLVVQRGDLGHLGEVAGWDWLDVEETSRAPAGGGEAGAPDQARATASAVEAHDHASVPSPGLHDDAERASGGARGRPEAMPAHHADAGGRGPRVESALERFAGSARPARQVFRLRPRPVAQQAAVEDAASPRPHVTEVPHTPGSTLVEGPNVARPRPADAVSSRSGARIFSADNVLLALAGVVVLVATVATTRRRPASPMQTTEERE